MREKVVVVASLVLALLWAGSAGAQDAGDIRIGVIAPLSGAVPTFGAAIKNGVAMALKECNDRGGINGHRIVAIYTDGQCRADLATEAAQKLITQDGVRYIIGEVCSKASIPVSELANASRVIQVTPTSTNMAVTVDAQGRVKPYIFRACFVDPFQGLVAAKFATNQLSARTAFILFDSSNDYVSGLARSFEESFVRLGGTVVGKRTYSNDTTDFSALLAEVRSQQPDLVYLPDYYNVVNLAVKQARRAGITCPFMGGDGWDSSDLDMRATEGCYYTNHFSLEDPRPEVQTFQAAYSAFLSDSPGKMEPDVIAALGYDSANLILRAMENAGSDDVDSVRQALEGIQFHGVTGRLTFDVSHNPVKSAVIMVVKQHAAHFETLIEP
ncbi:MAG: ABC transporter substrate-binding protein [Spirochaetia bacterium]|jgi:branched-chain amino acid transport system substrate-binding protein